MNNAKVDCGECKYHKGIVIPTGANPKAGGRNEQREG
jgi:hypothetical protein